jgi:hypothetical protein
LHITHQMSHIRFHARGTGTPATDCCFIPSGKQGGKQF